MVCNYIEKTNGGKKHKPMRNATYSFWISHNNALVHVYCCNECADKVRKTGNQVSESIIVQKNG